MSTHTPSTIDQLQQQFAIPEAVRFEPGEGGLTRAVLISPAARGEIYLYGAHAASYQRTGEPEMIFLSDHSYFEPGKEIRGGIPICFPWFGDHGEPKHGVARTQSWEVANTYVTNDSVTIELTNTIVPYEVRYRMTVGPTLEVAMLTRNAGGEAATFELALHTYFAVSDVGEIEVAGLEGRGYLDKVQDFAECTQEGPIRFEGQVDRVYQHTDDTCTIRDPGHERAIVVEKENAHSTIVWNPSPEKKLADLGEESWRAFVCVESGNVHGDAVTLQPGETQETVARYTIQSLD